MYVTRVCTLYVAKNRVPYIMTVSTGGWVSRKCEITVSTLLSKTALLSPPHGKLFINTKKRGAFV